MCPNRVLQSMKWPPPLASKGRSVRRNAPTVYNVAYATRIFHDGRESTLEQQVWGPLLAGNEMGNPVCWLCD